METSHLQFYQKWLRWKRFVGLLKPPRRTLAFAENTVGQWKSRLIPTAKGILFLFRDWIKYDCEILWRICCQVSAVLVCNQLMKVYGFWQYDQYDPLLSQRFSFQILRCIVLLRSCSFTCFLLTTLFNEFQDLGETWSIISHEGTDCI